MRALIAEVLALIALAISGVALEVTQVSVADPGLPDFSPNSASDGARVSADGRYVVFQSDASDLVPGDTNNELDIFRRDLLTGETVWVSVAGAVHRQRPRDRHLPPDLAADPGGDGAVNVIPSREVLEMPCVS